MDLALGQAVQIEIVVVAGESEMGDLPTPRGVTAPRPVTTTRRIALRGCWSVEGQLLDRVVVEVEG